MTKSIGWCPTMDGSRATTKGAAMTMLRNLLLFCLGLILAGCDRPHWNGVNMSGVSWGKEFRLKDTSGRERTLAEFRGRPVMLFFGFVQCAEVCPTSLLRAAEVKKELGADGKSLQIILITVDPERDTPDLLRDYAAVFDPELVALRGDEAATRKTADEFRVYYQKVPTGNSYTVDHTALTYVFDADGNLRLGEPHNLTTEQVTQDLRQMLKPRSDS